MSSLRPVEKVRFEKLFVMDSGYVLDFTSARFQEFIRDTAGVDIYTDQYSINGDSKARRLRALWDKASDAETGKVLSGLLEYWSLQNPRPDESQAAQFNECQKIVARLLGEVVETKDSEDEFLNKDFGKVSLKSLRCDASLVPILESRLAEAARCIKAEAPLGAIFLCGSILEGLLLGTASANQRAYNTSPLSPKDGSGKVKQFHTWRLAELIDVACDVGHLKLDVKKFGHSLRDFRNYIHPHQQMVSRFDPDKHTAEICMQVLRAAIADLSGQRA